ncbi:phosphate-starvation-inducible PsiE family protein [Thermosulfurimonas sp.]|uniref:phosphate-starvation-inducible PsiE family protein n=1 Tax=Thermosulfurimonas sp. TaxID=2080236 RepID=UPI0025EDBB39|nr:phosphate-starvation-inducible PsiE family protein [Thermosulfurimonas sp.]
MSPRKKPPRRSGLDIWFQENFLRMERILYILVAIGIILATLEVIYDGFHALLRAFAYKDFALGVLKVIDRFLIALMFLEILYTVQIVFGEEYHLQCVEPFIMVAIIALVRRLLILAFEISHGEVTPERVKLYMLEMALVGALILALVGATIMLRKMRREERKHAS